MNASRTLALYHLRFALNTGIRGANANAVQRAIDDLERDHRGELTDLHYRRLTAGQRLTDPRRPGFLARATKGGTTLYYRYSHPKTMKQTEARIGPYPQTTLAEGRAQWKELRAQRLCGEVPSPAQDTQDTGLPTMNELVRRYVSEYAEKVKRSGADDDRMLRREVLPRYGDLSADKFTPGVVWSILSPIKERGAGREAEKVRAVLSTLFNVARGRTRKIDFPGGEPWLPRDFPNPVEGVNLATRKPQTYSPKNAELAALVRKLPSSDMREDLQDLLTLQLQTCSRIGEVSGMRWDEMDGDVWVLPATRVKNNTEHRVMLSRQSLVILERRRPLSRASSFVFPSPRDLRKPVGMDALMRALAKSRQDLGVSGRFTSHVPRHACLTWLAEAGHGKEIRDRISNHLPPKSEGVDWIYNSAQLNGPARDALQAWCDYLDALAAENVVALGRRS